MQQLKTKLQNASASFGSGFRNVCIGATGLAIAGGANAALVDESVTGYVDAAKTDGEGIGKLIIGAVAVVVAVSLIIGLMRKA